MGVRSLPNSTLSNLPASIWPPDKKCGQSIQYLHYLHEEVKAGAAVGIHPSEADMGIVFFLSLLIFFFFSWISIGSLGPALEKYPREKDPPVD